MTKKMEAIISKLKELGVKDNTTDSRFAEYTKELTDKGYAVIQAVPYTMNIMGDIMETVSYIIVSKYDTSVNQYFADLKDGYVFADVQNLTAPFCSEMGTIGAQLQPNGMFKRVY